MIGVYAIICLSNRRYYIGQSIHVGRRWRDHKRRLRKGEHPSKGLQKAWKKYGESDFVFVMIEATSKRNVLKREAYWITKLKPYLPSNGFNKKGHGPQTTS